MPLQAVLALSGHWIPADEADKPQRRYNKVVPDIDSKMTVIRNLA